MTNQSVPKRFAALRTRNTDGHVSSSIEHLGVEDLSPGEVLLRARYAGVNYKDCLAIHGEARIIKAFPRTAGIEVVGEVLDSAHQQAPRGTEVLVHGFETGIAFDGGFSEVVRVPAKHVQQVPAGLTPHQAAILGVPGFTAAMALEQFEQRGLAPDSGLVAVSGAGGAVGMLAIAILARAGWRVAALTRRMAQEPVLRELGAAEVIDSRVAMESQRPLEKARFAAAIDNVGGPVLSWLLRSMCDGGCVASVGNAAGNGYEASVLPFIMRRVQLFGVVANAPWPQRLRLWGRLAGELRPDFDKLMPHVHHLRLEELMDHARLQLQGATSGRALVTFEGAQ
ncbi:YhdH/YhfP family quinone oxidoreductase [Cupriavidus sp. NPDC089707]|uniref:YhdH/YhfP family quinone oxidoreductase n=1 Tax=Cupriavidus sp. NPDC089707 TaxID=3363963 RepID=UPI00380D18F7